jgi:dipeptidyl aminopeptidase/acylaminoacyl peptidase
VDPSKVCIVGFGYGGYSALLGAELEPATYRCVASIGGPAAFRQWLFGVGDISRRYWERYIGAQQLTDGVLRPISPMDQASKIKVPVLLVHAEDDTAFPIAHSRLMEGALKQAGKTVQFEILKDEDHSLSHDATRLQMLTTLVAFLEKNNPPN